MTQKQSSPLTVADTRELITKMNELIEAISSPEQDEVDSANQIVGLLTEIVQVQQAQQNWLEAISEKIDLLIESADGAS